MQSLKQIFLAFCIIYLLERPTFVQSCSSGKYGQDCSCTSNFAAVISLPTVVNCSGGVWTLSPQGILDLRGRSFNFMFDTLSTVGILMNAGTYITLAADLAAGCTSNFQHGQLEFTPLPGGTVTIGGANLDIQYTAIAAVSICTFPVAVALTGQTIIGNFSSAITYSIPSGQCYTVLQDFDPNNNLNLISVDVSVTGPTTGCTNPPAAVTPSGQTFIPKNRTWVEILLIVFGCIGILGAVLVLIYYCNKG